MIHAETLQPISKNVFSSGAYRQRKAQRQVPVPSATMKMAFQSLELDGHDLWRQREEIAISQLTAAIKLADANGKTELNINNIAPWIVVGKSDTSQVPKIQRDIQQNLAAACKSLHRGMPESRLDLNRGEFAIRCYLGRIKPTDHVYTEDMISDSR